MRTVKHSQVRDELTCRKRVKKDTGWRADELPPRYSAFPASRPCGRRWEWRCFVLETEDGRSFRMLVEVSPHLSKWKAMLIRAPEGAPPVAIMRFEDQPGAQGGLHVHASCDDNRDLTGADSVNMTYTLPDHGRTRRRRRAWTKALFCKAAGEFFRTDPISGQEEMEV